MGKVLFVNLTTGDIEEQKIADDVYERFLSGSGLGAYILYKHIPENIDPLGPDNMLGFVSGLLTGTPTLMTGRWMAVCKSPLTGGWGDANCGGHFSPAIKRCGYDAIFFKGVSAKPVYLHIDKKGIELRDASHVWGKDAVEAEEVLLEECKGRKKPQAAVLGTAGEKLSLISGIVHDGGRIAARSGVGAVMGSKRLKAVVLNGSKAIKCQNTDKLKEISKTFAKKTIDSNFPSLFGARIFRVLAHLMARKSGDVEPGDLIPFHPAAFKETGTVGGTELIHIIGDSPTKNWSGSPKDFPNRKRRKVGNVNTLMKREYKKYHCYACAWGCGGLMSIKDVGNGEFEHTHKPEYETAAAFGSLLLNGDQNSVLYVNELLNRAGMDSISAGGTVAFAIECYENGILTKADTDGLALSWGNTEAIIALVKKMIAREGIGDILADGSRAASRKIGKGSEAYAITAGGQEPGMHEPRFHPLLALQFSGDPTPGRHTGGAYHYQEMALWEKVSFAPKQIKQKKADLAVPSEENGQKAMLVSAFKSFVDGTGGCLLAMEIGVKHFELGEMMNAATNWNKSYDDYFKIGMRIHTLKQMFGIRQGVEPKDYIVHKRVVQPLKDGPTKGIGIPIEGAIKYFWKQFGFDENTGKPTAETIDMHGLDKLDQEEESELVAV
jgi:aldehyde:ferredoxin oxidoreductase